MDDAQRREVFDTGLSRIRHEIKSRLVIHGLHGTVTYGDTGPEGQAPTGSTIVIVVKGRSATRSFDRDHIEKCSLRVSGAVLLGIIAMVEELSV